MGRSRCATRCGGGTSAWRELPVMPRAVQGAAGRPPAPLRLRGAGAARGARRRRRRISWPAATCTPPTRATSACSTRRPCRRRRRRRAGRGLEPAARRLVPRPAARGRAARLLVPRGRLGFDPARCRRHLHLRRRRGQPDRRARRPPRAFPEAGRRGLLALRGRRCSTSRTRPTTPSSRRARLRAWGPRRCARWGSTRGSG